MRGTGRWATAAGLVSILVWSTSVSVSRLVTEDLGVLPATALVLLLAGLTLGAITVVRGRGVSWVRRLAPKHLAVCGPLFVGYILLLYIAVGTAPTRIDALVAGLANYLWPAMILLFSVLVLRRRAQPAVLGIGILVCLVGILLAASVSAGGWRPLLGGLANLSPSLGLGVIAAVLWGLYSVMARVFRQTVSSGAVALFLFVAGLGALALGRGAWGGANWSCRAVVAGLYMAWVPNSLAYWFWDESMRSGDVPTLGALSNLIPILSMLVGTAVLSVGVRWELIGGGLLVVVGAVVSRGAFARRAPEAPTAH